ncbi:hypothetical protein [Kitasatospora kifunensis]|uniref:Uncharacterized protein n=1 Tax=Kitasatospora kifunensis TaxID=58351 RepID=A0A7W7VUP0_KITKI|nr:hypothetical protein [Kitasatospora kifunensis]MBB4922680.1 hypothetical protein [Kitasatospora kifunensis]
MHGSPRTTSTAERTGVRRPLRHAAVLAGALLLVSACSSTHSSNGGTNGGTGGTDSIGTMTASSPTPYTVPYGITLNAAIGPVNDALAKLTSAGSVDDLNTDLATAQQAATSGSQSLQSANPPSSVSDANRQLSVALDTLATNLGAVQTDISNSKVCATSSALAETGAAQGLKDVPTALQSLATGGYTTTFNVPQTPQQQQRALDNGSLVRQGANDGSGELTVDNSGGTVDAVLTLVKGGQSAYSFYVVKGQSAKLTGIEDGTYDMYFAGGFDWDSSSKKFTESCAYTKFDDSTDFTTTSTTYSTVKITLQPVVGGNASTSTVPSGSYPVP